MEALVQEQRRYMPRIGGRKLYYLLGQALQEEGIRIGRDRFFDLLRARHLLVPPRKSYLKTTYSKHWMHKYPNLSESMSVTGPNQLWVSDITGLKARDGVGYLSLVTDGFSRKIVGWHLSTDMSTEQVIQALKMAVKTSLYATRGLIHHSDKGLQYCSSMYQRYLNKHGIQPSMTGGYDPYQNALAERINGILKQEFLTDVNQVRLAQLPGYIAQSIESYNQRRPHLSLKMRTPDNVHKKAGADLINTC